ncbi:DUF2255 family protein [Caballeronia sp. AZ10_KS36]|uniref:DUF2255 family protein n=1 Tax=Caballeronia sp. AZ10_KS36 TaxID=2921757 RepID=UPI00202810F1|nr:DUF2255 family protein [Caballeronia sp. AZ10_KS36]
MASWSEDEISAIAESDDLHVSPLRDDGVTYGTPTWIWSVVVDGDLYVRAYNGRASGWYNAAMRQKGGRVRVAGTIHEVGFEAIDGPVNDRIDDAYRTKYGTSSYLGSMVSVRARAATVKVLPRS